MHEMFIQKFQKGWSELLEEVINTGKCYYCGACGAFCANIKFNPETELPEEDGSCKDANTCRDGYGLCYNICPKTELETFPISLLDKWVFGIESNKILGHYLEIASIKLTEKGRKIIQEPAGPLTALLWIAMEKGLIDASIITGKDEKFKPYPMIAETADELLKGAGYKPCQSPTLSLIGEAINKEHSDIAVVGTPCQIQALRKLQNHPIFDFEAHDLVTLAIGTFCFGTFHNKPLFEIFEEYGIKAEDILEISTDKNQFKMMVKTNSGNIEIPMNELYEKAIRKVCFSCSDYTASFADISIGKVGSDENWDTIIIRTPKGQEIFELALKEGIIEKKQLEPDKEELILDITRAKTDISIIENIIEHSPHIKSFIIRNPRIAQTYKPGMFVILWLPGIDFLPMSISNVDNNLIEITVEKIGEGTAKLFELNVGDFIGIRGPYGNSFNYEDYNNILIVGGGMGIAALTSLIQPLKKNKKNVFVSIGAKDKASLIFANRLIEQIPNTSCTTDDGSFGKKCFVTDTIEDIIKNENIDLIITCGPEIMMKKVLEIADSHGIEVQVSLERKMKCGVGLCGSCCVGENNDIAICKEGPIFNSSQLKQFPQFGTYKK